MNRFPFIFLFLLSSLFANSQSRTRQSHLIYSNALSEDRQIIISLPEDYELGNNNYGVLYVLDAEYTFGFAEGAVDFLSNAFGYVPPLIIVGVPNIDRGRDMNVTHNPNDSYTNFLKFIETELMEFVNQMYCTNNFDMLYGWSSASNINMQFLAKNPNLFDAHIQSGTGIGTKTANFLSEHLVNNSYKNAYLYANTEGTGLRPVGLKKYQNLINDLSPEGLVWKFELMDSSSHVNVIADGIYRGLRFVFAEFYISDTIVLEGADSIINYYKSINGRYNFHTRIPEGALMESAGILIQEEKSDEAIELLKYGVDLYPNSADIPGTLGEICEYLGQKKKASKYYRMAFQRSLSKSPAAMKYGYLHKKSMFIK